MVSFIKFFNGLYECLSISCLTINFNYTKFLKNLKIKLKKIRHTRHTLTFYFCNEYVYFFACGLCFYGSSERSHFIVFFLPLTACLELMLMTCCKSTFKSHKISVLSSESPSIEFNFDCWTEYDERNFYYLD